MRKLVVGRRNMFGLSILFLLVSPIFSSIYVIWASGPNCEKISMSTVENVNVLSSGDALLTLALNMPNSSLAGVYREMLAVPSDARMGEEMPIPQMAQEEFYKSVKQEQKFSFGFTTQVLGSSMVPKGENNEFEVSVDAIATLQVINVTAVGSDGIWEVKIGPRDDDIAETVAGYLFSKIMFAQMLLESLDGEQAYEASWIMRINLPEEATLLNNAEFSGLTWILDFGGGTFISTCVSVVESTIVFDEKTIVREENFTADPTEIYEVFRDHKAFVIRYLLPDSASMGLERFTSGVFERDFFWEPTAELFNFQNSETFVHSDLSVTLEANASLAIYAGIAWDFDWSWDWPPGWELDWFKAWVGAKASVGISLDVTCAREDGMSYDGWKDEELGRDKIESFKTLCGPIPVWADLNLYVLADLDVSASTALNYGYSVGFGAGFEAGAKWHDSWDSWLDWDTWQDLDTPTISITQASVHAKATLRFTLAFMLYGVAGPSLELAPYVDGRHTPVDEECSVWEVTLGLKLNIGVHFAGKLADWIDLHDPVPLTLWKDVIMAWSGWTGRAPARISVSLHPDSTYIGGGTTIIGSVSTDYGSGWQSLVGKVKIEVSYDNVSYVTIGTTTSLDLGGYSYWWVPSSAGTLYIRSKWLGNDKYRGATSESVVLSVSSIPLGMQWLYHDDGSNGGVQTLQYPIGRAVRFTAPTFNSMLVKINVLGGYVGVDDHFYIEVWDSNFNELFSNTYMFHLFEPYDPYTPLTWATINIPNINVSGDFYIVISAYERADPESRLVIGSDWTPPGPHWPYLEFPNSFRVNIEDNSIIEPPSPDGHRYCYFIQAGIDVALLDHTTCKDIEDEYPVERTNDFCITDEYAYSWVKFARNMGYHTLTWQLWDPDNHYTHVSKSIETSPDWDGIAWVQIPIASIKELLEPYLGKTFKIKIFLDADLYFTEYCRVWSDYSISIALSQSSIVLGESIEISSQTSSAFTAGTTKIQYWLGTWPYVPGWNDIAVGTPETGYYSRSWVPPHAGTYFIRAIWGEYLDYSEMESPFRVLKVNQATTELSTSLNTTMASAGSDITITATMTPTLAGKNIQFQYSPDDLTWYYISTGTTDSTGQCSHNWTVHDTYDHYYVRTIWNGENDYSGTASPSQYLEVLPQVVTNVVSIKNVTLSKTEITQGDLLSIDVEVENLGNDTANFDLLTLANETLVETKSISLGKGESSTVTFTWDTAGFALGNYKVRVYAPPAPIEDNLDDNIYIERLGVIPEFSSSTMLLIILMLTSLTALVLCRKKKLHIFKG